MYAEYPIYSKIMAGILESSKASDKSSESAPVKGVDGVLVKKKKKKKKKKKLRNINLLAANSEKKSEVKDGLSHGDQYEELFNTVVGNGETCLPSISGFAFLQKDSRKKESSVTQSSNIPLASTGTSQDCGYNTQTFNSVLSKLQDQMNKLTNSITADITSQLQHKESVEGQPSLHSGRDGLYGQSSAEKPSQPNLFVQPSLPVLIDQPAKSSRTDQLDRVNSNVNDISGKLPKQLQESLSKERQAVSAFVDYFRDFQSSEALSHHASVGGTDGKKSVKCCESCRKIGKQNSSLCSNKVLGIKQVPSLRELARQLHSANLLTVNSNSHTTGHKQSIFKPCDITKVSKSDHLDSAYDQVIKGTALPGGHWAGHSTGNLNTRTVGDNLTNTNVQSSSIKQELQDSHLYGLPPADDLFKQFNTKVEESCGKLFKSEEEERLERLRTNAKVEVPKCTCRGPGSDPYDENHEGPYYTHLGAAASLVDIRNMLEQRFDLKGSAIRIEKVRYTGKEGKSSQGCPIAKWILRRSGPDEKVMGIVKHRAGHYCPTAYIIVAIVAWDGVPPNMANDMYDFLINTVTNYGFETDRRCGTNDTKTCACQGWDLEQRGASFSFGCSWSMYFNGCKFARSREAKRFKLKDTSLEATLEGKFQNLATHVGPLYKQSAPESYENQVEFEELGHECRLGKEPGRPFSGVTTCMDFCAHAHKDLHNMNNGCTVVVTLTKHRGFDKADDEQLHVLPLYVLDHTDEFGSEEGLYQKVRNGSLEVLSNYPMEARIRAYPLTPKKRGKGAKKDSPPKKEPKSNNTTPTKHGKDEYTLPDRQLQYYMMQQLQYQRQLDLQGQRRGEQQPSQPAPLDPSAQSGPHTAPNGFPPAKDGKQQAPLYEAFWNYFYKFGSFPPQDFLKPEQMMPTPQQKHENQNPHRSNSVVQEAFKGTAGQCLYDEKSNLPAKSSQKAEDHSHIDGTISGIKSVHCQMSSQINYANSSQKVYQNSSPFDPESSSLGPAKHPDHCVEKSRMSVDSPTMAQQTRPAYETPNEKLSSSNDCTPGNYAQCNQLSGPSPAKRPFLWNQPSYPRDNADYLLPPGNSDKTTSQANIFDSPLHLLSEAVSIRSKAMEGDRGHSLQPRGESMTSTLSHNQPGMKVSSGIPESARHITEPNHMTHNQTRCSVQPDIAFNFDTESRPDCADGCMRDTNFLSAEMEYNEDSFLDPEIGGVAVALSHGSVYFEVAKRELHATTALRKPNRKNPTRISMVFYQHKSMNLRHHGWYENERKAELMRQKRLERMKAESESGHITNEGDIPSKPGPKKKKKKSETVDFASTSAAQYQYMWDAPNKHPSTLTTDSIIVRWIDPQPMVTGPYQRWVSQ